MPHLPATGARSPPAPEGTTDFWSQRRWLNDLRTHVETWREARFPDVTVRMTGDPVFVAEIECL